MAKPLLPYDSGTDRAVAAATQATAVPIPRSQAPQSQVLTGILFVLKTGIPWEYLPLEMGCGSGMTCWRRLRDWQAAGVWQQLHEILLAELNAADKIDWWCVAIDASFVRALGGGERTGPSPVDRRKKGSKHHVLTDGHGVSLAATTTAANVNDVTQPGTGRGDPAGTRQAGSASPPPDRRDGDRGYDSEPERRRLRRRGIEPFLRGAVRSMAAGWGSTVGLWSGRCRGCMRSGNSGFGPTVESIFIRRSCPRLLAHLPHFLVAVFTVVVLSVRVS